MTLTSTDLALVCLILAFALWGAFQGVARQIAHAVAGIAAWFAAKLLGDYTGYSVSKWVHVSLVIGTVLATFVSFILIFVLVRYLLTLLLRRIIAGKDPTNRTADRVLGFLVGGAKVAALAWVIVCALSFVEDNVTVQGKKFGLTPKGSIAFDLARKYNLFEMSQFSGVNDLVRVVNLQKDPKTSAKLKESADFQALMKDPRFAAALENPAVKRVLGGGDTRPLLSNNQLLELLQDPLAMQRISRIAELSER